MIEYLWWCIFWVKSLRFYEKYLIAVTEKNTRAREYEYATILWLAIR